MNWYILVLIIDVPAVHLSIFYLSSDIQGWKMNTEGVAQIRRILWLYCFRCAVCWREGYSFWESRKIKGGRALEIKSERSSIERKLSSFIFLFCTKL